jgi:hypothetical protein
MNNNYSLSKITGWVTLLSGIVALISYYLVAASVNFNFDFFSNPASIFTTQGVSSEMMRWSMITDVFGYYLMLLPVVFYFKKWLSDKTLWSSLITFLGTTFIIMGALGATILATVWPYLLETYSTTSAQEQGNIVILFQTFSQVVAVGIWNLLDGITGGLWWLFIGFFLLKSSKSIAWLSILVGILMLLDSMGNIFTIKALSDYSLNIYLILAPVWAIIMGIAMLKNKIPLVNK